MSLIVSDTGLSLGEGLQFKTAIGGAGLTLTLDNSAAANLVLDNGGVGFAIVFTDTYFVETTGFMGSAFIKD